MQQQHGATARPFGDAVVGNVRRGPSIGGIFTFRLAGLRTGWRGPRVEPSIREEGISRSQRLSEKGTNIPLVRPPLPTARFRTHWTMMIRISPISGISPSESHPAALAVGEETNASAIETRDAFLTGAEAACRIGMVLGRVHYQRGFHQTATAGAIGATVAAGRLYRLTTNQMRNALSLVATRAFRPQVAIWDDGEAIQRRHRRRQRSGSGELCEARLRLLRGRHSRARALLPRTRMARTPSSAWPEPPPQRWIFEDNKYKLHACCHGTHAMIEALRDAMDQRRFSADELNCVTVFTHPRWLKVCDIKEPRTGLEVKFSYVHLAAMVVSGIDTSSDKIYTASLAGNEDLRKLADCVEVVGDETLGDMAARVVIRFEADKGIEVSHDLASHLPLDVLERGLRSKASGLLGADPAEKLWASVSALDRLSAGELAALLIR